MLTKTQKDLTKLINNSSKLIGTRQVLKAIINGTIAKVIIATNIDEVLFSKLKSECSNYNIPMVREFSKHELGKMCNIDVDCAVIGILKWLCDMNFLRGCNGKFIHSFKEEKTCLQ